MSANPTPADYNKAVPLEQKQRMVAHELGHFYQAQRLLGINLDVTFGYHYVDGKKLTIETQALMQTPDGQYMAQSENHGGPFVDKLDELVANGSFTAEKATRYNFCRMLGGGEMEKAVYGGESQGEVEDVQMLRNRLSQTWLSPTEQWNLENQIRTEVRQSITTNILQKVKQAVHVLTKDEYFNGQRTDGEVLHGILEGS